MADSTITVSGTLAAEPELRFAGNGNAVAGFSLAVNHRFMKDGEWQDGEVTWWRVSAFGALAENFAASFHKGDRVIVVGRPQARTWEDKEGNNRVSIDIMADDIGGSVKWARGEFERVTKEKTGKGAAKAKPAPRAAYGGAEEPF